MKHPFIRAELQDKGWPPSRIADDLGVPRSNVSQVIRGKATSQRIAERISEVLGIPMAQLWPGKYESRRGRYGRRTQLKPALTPRH